MAKISLADMKKNRSAMMEKVTKSLDEGSQQQDKRFWKVTRDKSGTGSAVIRFLPPVDADSLPWTKVFNYAFQGPTGKWFINECPSTIGLPSPVLDANRELYNTGYEADKKLAASRKRKTQFISNILVIKDPSNPENEGKVFLFRFGKSIYDMIASALEPEFEDQDSVSVWDLWEGADFKLRVKMKDKYPNYDSSEFADPSELFGGDEEKLNEVVEASYSLKEFHDASRFKSYDDLKKEFDAVINAKPVAKAAEQAENEDSGEDARALLERASKAERVDTKRVEKVEKVSKVEKTIKAEDNPASGGDDDDNLDYFKSLLENT